ncbi:MAG: hypothetical protein K9M82_00515 [Deltaproteobacteria bacterium]|nr:hypothetical protein [Deltaproteobacteria bacterium]
MIAVFLTLPWVFSVVPAYSGGRESLTSRDVTVVYPVHHLRSAEKILDLYPSVRGELEEHLRWSVTFHPTVILVADSGAFRQMTDQSNVVALAVSRGNLILIDLSAVDDDPSGLRSSLEHELCHLLLHARIPKGSLPRWLNEGIAQWVSGGFSEVRLPRRGSVLDQAVVSGRTIPVEYLSASFHDDGRRLQLAYEQSLSLVQFLIDRFGVDTLLSLLESLAEGGTLEQALSKHGSLTMASLEEAWLEDLEDKLAWTTLLIGHLYEILFFLAAASLVVGFARHVKRKRAAMEALDDADGENG